VSRPASTCDLRPPERAFVTAMRQLRFGRFKSLRIERGEFVLDPWPKTVRDVKFCSTANQPEATGAEFLLKEQVVELLEYVRGVESGEIRVLEVKNGLPFSMEIEPAPYDPGGLSHG
jgi:hypothetical protein